MGFQRNKDTVGEGRALQYTTIKVRIYPTPEQAAIMDKTFDCCRLTRSGRKRRSDRQAKGIIRSDGRFL